MKKFLVVLMALLFATGAFAQDAKKSAEFKYSVWAQAEGVTENNMAIDDNSTVTTADDFPKAIKRQYSDIRVRPAFTLGTDDVKVVTKFEIDQVFGSSMTAADVAAGNSNDDAYADKGVDSLAVEVKNAYIEAIAMPGLTLKAGAMAYYFPVIIDDDFAMYTAAYDFGAGSVTFGYAKTFEGSMTEKTTLESGAVTKSEDDAEVYIVDATFKAGAITVRPALFYSTAQLLSAGVYQDNSGLMGAINVAADMGALGVELTAAYASGTDSGSATDVDYSGYALDVYPTIKLSESIKLGAFFTYMTGDDVTTTDENEAFSKSIGGFTDDSDMGRMYIVEDANNLNIGMATAYDATSAGYMAYGITADATMDKLSIHALVGSAMFAEEIQVDAKKGLGIEIDLRAAYSIATGTTLWVEGGYLMAGDFLTKTLMPEENIDPMYAAFGLTTSL